MYFFGVEPFFIHCARVFDQFGASCRLPDQARDHCEAIARTARSADLRRIKFPTGAHCRAVVWTPDNDWFTEAQVIEKLGLEAGPFDLRAILAESHQQNQGVSVCRLPLKVCEWQLSQIYALAACPADELLGPTRIRAADHELQLALEKFSFASLCNQLFQHLAIPARNRSSVENAKPS